MLDREMEAYIYRLTRLNLRLKKVLIERVEALTSARLARANRKREAREALQTEYTYAGGEEVSSEQGDEQSTLVSSIYAIPTLGRSKAKSI